MADSLRKPMKEGVVPKGQSLLDAKGRVKKYPMRLTGQTSLTGMTEAYKFFTPAILYVHGNFNDAPFADFVNETGIELRIEYHLFDKPIFTNLNIGFDTNWNRVLWAVPIEQWRPFSDWLVSITLMYKTSGVLAKIGEQHLRICDPLRTDTVRPAEPLDIVSFGLVSSACTIFLRNTTYGLPPQCAKAEGNADLKAFADTLKTGGNPLNPLPAGKESDG